MFFHRLFRQNCGFTGHFKLAISNGDSEIKVLQKTCIHTVHGIIRPITAPTWLEKCKPLKKKKSGLFQACKYQNLTHFEPTNTNI